MTETILVITFDMIPYTQNWGGCQRIFFLSEFLQEKGFNVIVVHLKNNYYNMFGKNLSFSTIALEIDILSKINSQINSYNSADDTNKREVLTKFIKHNLNRFFFLIKKERYNEIDPYQGFLGELLIEKIKKNISTIIKSNDIHKVIISGPPFSLFSIMKYFKENFIDLKVILDYRDPWNLWNMGNQLSRHNEYSIIRLADHVVFVNERLRDDTIKLFNLDKNRCSVVFNGYSEKDWQEIIRDNENLSLNKRREQLIISYIGSMSFNKGGYRDLSTFLLALEKFRYKDKVRIRFVGAEASEEAEEIAKKFKNSIEFIPRVSYKRSLEYMLDSDILLLVHTDKKSAKYVVTGKFFDYARSGKIILGISNDKDAYFMNLIERHKLGIASLNEEEQILKALNLIYYEWDNGKIDDLRKTSSQELKNFSRDNQNKEFIKILHNLG